MPGNPQARGVFEAVEQAREARRDILRAMLGSPPGEYAATFGQ